MRAARAPRLVALALGAAGAALDDPLLNLPVAQLHVLRVLLQEGVQPIKGALVREGHWEEHVVLAVLGRRGLRNGDVCLGSLLQGVAGKGQRCERRWAEVY